jgi:hypothetical protein
MDIPRTIPTPASATRIPLTGPVPGWRTWLGRTAELFFGVLLAAFGLHLLLFPLNALLAGPTWDISLGDRAALAFFWPLWPAGCLWAIFFGLKSLPDTLRRRTDRSDCVSIDPAARVLWSGRRGWYLDDILDVHVFTRVNEGKTEHSLFLHLQSQFGARNARLPATTRSADSDCQQIRKALAAQGWHSRPNGPGPRPPAGPVTLDGVAPRWLTLGPPLALAAALAQAVFVTWSVGRHVQRELSYALMGYWDFDTIMSVAFSAIAVLSWIAVFLWLVIRPVRIADRITCTAGDPRVCITFRTLTGRRRDHILGPESVVAASFNRSIEPQPIGSQPPVRITVDPRTPRLRTRPLYLLHLPPGPDAESAFVRLDAALAARLPPPPAPAPLPPSALFPD